MSADMVTSPAPSTGTAIDAASHLPAGEPVSLAGLNAEQVVARLRELRVEAAGPVAIEVPLPHGRSVHEGTDFVEVDGRVYAGRVVDGAWHFQPTSLAMACLHTGWLVAGSLGGGEPKLPVDPNEPTIEWSEANRGAYRQEWARYRASAEYQAFRDGPLADYWAAFKRFINSPWGDGAIRWVLTPGEAVA